MSFWDWVQSSHFEFAASHQGWVWADDNRVSKNQPFIPLHSTIKITGDFLLWRRETNFPEIGIFLLAIETNACLHLQVSTWSL